MAVLVIAGILIAAATAWYLSRALASAPAVAVQEQQPLLTARDRLLSQLNELDLEAADRGLDAATVVDERARLEAELAGVLRELEQVGVAGDAPARVMSRRAHFMVAGMLALALPLVAGGFYVLKHQKTLQGLAGSESAAGGVQGEQMVLEMVGRLEQRLKEQPEDAAGWARLGRSYGVLGRGEEAAIAYQRSLKLAPDNIEALSEYAWLLYGPDPGNTSEPIYSLYARLNKLDPDNRDALWFLGLAAYQKGEFPGALKHWERLAKLVPPEDPAAESLRAVINKARERSRGK